MMDGTSGAYDQTEHNEIIALDNGEWAVQIFAQINIYI